MPSVNHTLMRPVAVAACACLLAVGAAGCSTTQEKAAAKQAESRRILAARKHRQDAKKHDHKTHEKGSKKR